LCALSLCLAKQGVFVCLKANKRPFGVSAPFGLCLKGKDQRTKISNDYKYLLYLLIVFLPAICGLCALLLGRPLGHRGAALITCGGLITTALISTVAFYEVVLNESPCSIKLAP